MEKIIQAWENFGGGRTFEIAVTDKRTGEETCLIFDIALDAAKKEFVAQAQRERVAHKALDVDADISLDGHLAALFELCLHAIISSDYFECRE